MCISKFTKKNKKKIGTNFFAFCSNIKTKYVGRQIEDKIKLRKEI